MSHERRIHSRSPAKVPARLSREADTLDGVIENLGEGGVLFATETLEVPLEEGAAVRVEFDARRANRPERITRTGTVLRTERTFDGTAVVRALAIRFDEPLDVRELTLS